MGRFVSPFRTSRIAPPLPARRRTSDLLSHHRPNGPGSQTFYRNPNPYILLCTVSQGDTLNKSRKGGCLYSKTSESTSSRKLRIAPVPYCVVGISHPSPYTPPVWGIPDREKRRRRAEGLYELEKAFC